MLLIVDFNVVFSALAKKGKPLLVFELNDIFHGFEFVSTQYMYSELDGNLDKVIALSKLSRDEISEVLDFIKRSVEIIPFEAFNDKAMEAVSIAPHLKDVPYVALSLKLDCKILSGDRGLMETLPDKVVTPSKAIDILLGRAAP